MDKTFAECPRFRKMKVGHTYVGEFQIVDIEDCEKVGADSVMLMLTDGVETAEATLLDEAKDDDLILQTGNYQMHIMLLEKGSQKHFLVKKIYQPKDSFPFRLVVIFVIIFLACHL